MTKKNYHETLKKCPGLLHFPLLNRCAYILNLNRISCCMRTILGILFRKNCFSFWDFLKIGNAEASLIIYLNHISE